MEPLLEPEPEKRKSLCERLQIKGSDTLLVASLLWSLCWIVFCNQLFSLTNKTLNPYLVVYAILLLLQVTVPPAAFETGHWINEKLRRFFGPDDTNEKKKKKTIIRWCLEKLSVSLFKFMFLISAAWQLIVLKGLVVCTNTNDESSVPLSFLAMLTLLVVEGHVLISLVEYCKCCESLVFFLHLGIFAASIHCKGFGFGSTIIGLSAWVFYHLCADRSHHLHDRPSEGGYEDKIRQVIAQPPTRSWRYCSIIAFVGAMAVLATLVLVFVYVAIYYYFSPSVVSFGFLSRQDLAELNPCVGRVFYNIFV